MNSFDMPFKIIWCDENSNETVIENWKEKKAWNFRFFEADMLGLEFSLLEGANEEFELRVVNKSVKDIVGRVCVKYNWGLEENGYTLIPAVFYNGNVQNETHGIPRIDSENLRVRFPISAASVPAVLVWDGKEEGLHYSVSPFSAAGWNGVTLDNEKKSLSFFMPDTDSEIYGFPNLAVKKRYPHVWHKDYPLCLRFSYRKFEAHNVNDIFKYLWDTARRLPRYPSYNFPKIEPRKAVKSVADWLLKKHYFLTKEGIPMLMNAFVDIERENVPDENFAEWNTIIGWVSGPMTALPLLRLGEEAREAAIKYLDFVTSDGFAPSGVKLPVFNGKEWIDPRPEKNGTEKGYLHCRFYGDYLYYLGRAIRQEKQDGFIHKNWEETFEKGINILIDLWNREKDFGIYWNIFTEKVSLNRRGTGAGAFALLALTEAVRHFPENEELKTCVKEAASLYVERCVKTGRCGGGPNDIIEADDSESIAALSDALVQQYMLFGGEELLKDAISAAELFASWVMCYNPPFPGGTTLEGINVCGGVIANVQNRHVGPGICTNSARFLYDLGEILGDKRWIELYEQVKTAAINCVCTYDGEFFGRTFREPFATGMVSEQINVSDALNPHGFTWCVSASWPATNILLSWLDSPENLQFKEN